MEVTRGMRRKDSMGCRQSVSFSDDLMSDCNELIDIPLLDDDELLTDPAAFVGAWNDDDFWLSPSSPVPERETTFTSQGQGAPVISPPLADRDSVGSSAAEMMTSMQPPTYLTCTMPQRAFPHNGRAYFAAECANGNVLLHHEPYNPTITSLQSPAMDKVCPFQVRAQRQVSPVSSSACSVNFSPPWLYNEIVQQSEMMRLASMDHSQGYGRRPVALSAQPGQTTMAIDARHDDRAALSTFSDNDLIQVLTSRLVERMQGPKPETTPVDAKVLHAVNRKCNDGNVQAPPQLPSSPLSPVQSLSVEKAVQSASSTKRSLASSLQPVRPLTAYNFFFRFERDRLIKFCTEHGCNTDAEIKVALHDMPAKYCEHYQLTPENSADFQAKVLREQWSRDPTVKRQHKKTHGIITFDTLTHCISQSWKALPEPVRHVFRDIALKDAKRYREEIKQEVRAARKKTKVAPMRG